MFGLLSWPEPTSSGRSVSFRAVECGTRRYGTLETGFLSEPRNDVHDIVTIALRTRSERTLNKFPRKKMKHRRRGHKINLVRLTSRDDSIQRTDDVEEKKSLGYTPCV